MNVLGLSAFGQNPAACVLKKGKLTAFAEEERFIRLKSANGFFPSSSVKYALQQSKLKLKDIDQIAVGWNHNLYKYKVPLFLAKAYFKNAHIPQDNSIQSSAYELIKQHPSIITKKIKLQLQQLDYKHPLPPIRYYSHHLSHAASAFYCSGFESSAILIMDGSGELNATSIYHGIELSIKPLLHTDIPHSLGWFYAALGAYLGFKPYEQDGFLMGLAAYGSKNSQITKKIDRIISIQGDSYSVNPEYTLLGNHTFNPHFSDQLVELLGPPRLPHQPLLKRHKNIAYATQQALEEVALHLALVARQKTQSNNLSLSGGVSLNVKMNGRIIQSKLFHQVYIQPVSHDSGSSLGAAMLASRSQDPRFQMKHTYYGPQFSQTQIKSVLKEADVSYKLTKNISVLAARAIAKGKIVAWFQGPMEAGPRALGNRSILANPQINGINDHINNNIKHRDKWRPFCPSITRKHASKFFDSGAESSFMIVGYPIKNDLQTKIPAVVHVDGSARPHVVSKATNPKYHQLLVQVGKLTGIECVLNTSLNVKGEPIALSPEDALRCFFSTGIDYLALGDYWIEKPKDKK